MFFAALCMIVAASATAVTAFMIQPITDYVFVNYRSDLLVPLSIGIIIVFLIKALATYGQNVLMAFISQRVATDMQLALFEHLLYSDMALFSNQSSGRLISRFSNEINIIRRNLTQLTTSFIKEFLTMIFLIGVMFYQSWELSLVGFVAFPLAIYPTIRLGKSMRKIAGKTQDELGFFVSRLDDIFSGIKIVKAYGNEKYEIGRAEGVMESLFRLYMKAARVVSAASPIMEVLTGIAIGLVIWYGGSKVISQTITTGAFFSFIAAMMMAYKPSKSLTGINSIIQEAIVIIKRFFEIMDVKPVVENTNKAKPLTLSENDNKPGVEIEFRDVIFTYHQSADYKLLDTPLPIASPALKGISFKASAGKKIALVGPSGSGKSTIINLILRFYDPDRGTIKINETDIRDLTLDSLRSQISIVTQDAILFDDTIKANIAYGKRDTTEEEIIDAAYAAAAHDFITEQPHGYETFIGQHGVRLSGGQKQRIAIARAMLRNAPILLLDEATSSLDTISEQQVQAALDKLMAGRTTIVIAHRLSTILTADMICVIEDGKVLESGTHDELLAKKGSYHKLYERQFHGGQSSRWARKTAVSDV